MAIERELRELEQAMAGGAHDDATLDRYARAQAKLEHAGGYNWRDARSRLCTGSAFVTTPTSTASSTRSPAAS